LETLSCGFITSGSSGGVDKGAITTGSNSPSTIKIKKVLACNKQNKQNRQNKKRIKDVSREQFPFLAKLQPLNICFQMLLPQSTVVIICKITAYTNHKYSKFFHPLRDCGQL